MSRKKSNFTIKEKNLLKELLKGFKHIIENKKTDNSSSKMKKDAWNSIARLYNNSDVIAEKVSGEQLRRLWLNLKSRQKLSLIAGRQYRIGIGDEDICPAAQTNQEITALAEAILVEVPNHDSNTAFEQTTLHPSSSPPSFAIPRLSQQPVLQEPTDPPIVDAGHTINNFSNIRRLRLQLMRKEHKNKEERANELHVIEVEIMRQKLKEATARASIATFELEKLQNKL